MTMTEKLTVNYRVSSDVMKKEIIETGKAKDPTRTAFFELEPMTPETRQKLFDVGALELSSWGSFQAMIDIKSIPKWEPGQREESEQIRLDGEPTIEQVIEIMKKKKSAMDEIRSNKEMIREIEQALKEELQSIFLEESTKIREMAEDYEALNTYKLPKKITQVDTHESRDYTKELLKQRSDAIKELTAEKNERERREWSEHHGSEHLKKSLLEGFDCKKLYVIERAALEAPDFEVDYYDAAKFDYISCPTWAALTAKDEAEALGLGLPMIVKLTRPPDSSDNSDYPDDLDEPETAIMIERYLDEYNIFKVVG
jgi:hypothetical protein